MLPYITFIGLTLHSLNIKKFEWILVKDLDWKKGDLN
jgi:hypothetical protein